MSLTNEDIKRIAHLARLNLSDEEIQLYTRQLSNILDFVAHIDQIDTTGIDALAHPVECSQLLREDVVSENNQRDKFQAIAPQVEAGLYLVPKVIDIE